MYTLAHTQTYRCTAYGCVQHNNMILVLDVRSYGIGKTWVAQQYDLPLDIWSSAKGHADTRHHEAKREITTVWLAQAHPIKGMILYWSLYKPQVG